MNWFVDKMKSTFGMDMEEKAAVSAPISAEQLIFAKHMWRYNYELSSSQAMEIFNSNGAVYRAVNLIAQQVSNIKPTLSVNREDVQDHPILDLLRNPGFNRTTRQLLHELAVGQLVTGNAPLHLLGNSAFTPVAMDTLLPTSFTSDSSIDEFPKWVRINENSRSLTFYREKTDATNFTYLENAMSELLLVFDVQGRQKGIGRSPLNSIVEDIQLKMAGLQHNRSMMKRGARASGVLTFPQGLDEDGLKDVRAEINSTVAGSDNAGSIMVFSGIGEDGAPKFTQTSVAPKDMDWEIMMRFVDESVFTNYAIPLPIFDQSRATFNNYESSQKVFYEQAVIPCYTRISSQLTRMFSRRSGENLEIGFNPLSINILLSESIKRARDLISASIITPNEGRLLAGYKALDDEDADRLYLQGNLASMEEISRRLDEQSAEIFNLRNEKPNPKPADKGNVIPFGGT